MEHQVHCPSCRQRLNVAPELTGQQVTCPHCYALLAIPAPSTLSAATVAITCRCGMRFQTSSQMPAPQATCPACGTHVTVPTPHTSAPPPASTSTNGNSEGHHHTSKRQQQIGRVQVEETDEQLVVKGQAEYGMLVWLAFFFLWFVFMIICVLGVGTFALISGGLGSIAILAMICLPILSLAILCIGTWGPTLMNKRVLRIDANELRIGNEGPWPMPNASTSVPLEEIAEIRVRVQTINDYQNFTSSTTYHPEAIRHDGSRCRLHFHGNQQHADEYKAIVDHHITSKLRLPRGPGTLTAPQQPRSYASARLILSALALLFVGFLVVATGGLWLMSGRANRSPTARDIAVKEQVPEPPTKAAAGWTRIRLGVAERLSAVAAGDGKLMAVGDKGLVFRSEDGIEWTRVASGTTENLATVTFRNGLWIIGGSWYKTPQVLSFSMDEGATWQTARATDHYGITSIIEDGDDLVAVAFQGYVMVSQDGKTWQDRSNATRSTAYDIASGDGAYAVAGYKGKIGFSKSLTGPWQTTQHGGGSFRGVAYGAGRFVVVGSAGQIWTRAPNDNSWKRAHSGTNVGLADILFADNQFVAVGGAGTVLMSRDGLQWRRIPTGVTENLGGVCYDGKRHLIVGANGTLLLGTPDQRAEAPDNRAAPTQFAEEPSSNNSASSLSAHTSDTGHVDSHAQLVRNPQLIEGLEAPIEFDLPNGRWAIRLPPGWKMSEANQADRRQFTGRVANETLSFSITPNSKRAGLSNTQLKFTTEERWFRELDQQLQARNPPGSMFRATTEHMVSQGRRYTNIKEGTLYRVKRIRLITIFDKDLPMIMEISPSRSPDSQPVMQASLSTLRLVRRAAASSE